MIMEKHLEMMIVIKKCLLVFVILLVSSVGVLAQDEHLLIQSDKFKINLGSVTIDEIFFMDNEFRGLKKLGEPKNLDFKETASELYWVYTYDNLKLHYIDMGDGPTLIKAEIFNPSDHVTVDEESITSINHKKPQTFGRENKHVKKINSENYPTDYHKFGSQNEYLEIIMKNGEVAKIIFQSSLQI